MNAQTDVIKEVATEARRFFENEEREQELRAFTRESVPPDVENRIRQMHIEMADLLRKQCKLKVPEIRRYLDEMRSLTI